MTRAQRKTHVLLWLVLGPIALVGLMLAVLWRPPEPMQPGTAPGIEATTSEHTDAQRLGADDE